MLLLLFALLGGAVHAADGDNPPMAINLSGVNDYATQQPFIDVFKSARSWIGHKPGQWGGATHEDLEAAGYLDENGWPLEIPPELSSIGTVILTDLPKEAVSLAGRYRLTFDGDGIVEVGGRARNVRYGRNEVWFDFAPGPGSVDIRIQRTDRKRTGDHVRNIRVVKQENIRAYEAGAMFNPLFLDRLQGFEVLRFMDWMRTNNSTQSRWQDRPKPDDYTYSRKGVPVEIMVELANRTGADAWFCMPHLADDDYVRRFASLVRDRLWHEQKAWVELSNEVWNWQFDQARWARQGGIDRWGNDKAWMQYYGMRASEIADIWQEVFGAATETRLVRVVASQAGWLGLERDILEAPLWMAEPDAAGRKPPYAHFDAYAVTGYFGYNLGREDRVDIVRAWLDESRRAAEAVADEEGLSGAARADFVEAHRFDVAFALAAAEARDGLASDDPEGTLSDLLTRIFPYHAQVAERHGLDLVMYEGGTHVVGLGAVVEDKELTEFFIGLNYSAEMGELYRELIAGWYAAGGVLFNVFADVAKPGKWGSWGALRYLSDENPRWAAISAFR
ncbi:hypothetical protein [Jhaorihella thermophila]|uniref:hypothetical protein n=1 Tax=Jhaorihella thermophila TaxID=488547 RepID=UPI001F1C47DA|nr:hypothetical protein [Jhaorihella thermophila]